MTPRLIDTHTHTNFAAFKGDSKEAIKRALDSGVWLVNVGSQFSTSKRAVDIAQNYQEGVYAAVGLHPHHLYDQEINNAQEDESICYKTMQENFEHDDYLKLAQNEKVVAIGECGLDYFKLSDADIEEKKEKQKEIFVKHIELAKEVNKPLIIHCRDAHDDLLEILKSSSDKLPKLSQNKGVMHFFTGSIDEAFKYINLGFYISFSGVITFAQNYYELVKEIPLDCILIETDAPYVAPIPYRGKRNEPAYVAEVAKKIAEIKRISFEDVASQTVKNSRSLFKI